MIIQSGWAKGLKLRAMPGSHTRPTGSRVRAAALNMLQPWLEGAVATDLYAGTGAMGLELASRGAKHVTFVEKHLPVYRVLEQNLAALEARAQANEQVIQLLPRHNEVALTAKVKSGPFDIVWADPPYAVAIEELPHLLAIARHQLASDGIFMLETATRDASAVAATLGSAPILEMRKQKAYGETTISIIHRV